MKTHWLIIVYRAEIISVLQPLEVARILAESESESQPSIDDTYNAIDYLKVIPRDGRVHGRTFQTLRIYGTRDFAQPIGFTWRGKDATYWIVDPAVDPDHNKG